MEKLAKNSNILSKLIFHRMTLGYTFLRKSTLELFYKPVYILHYFTYFVHIFYRNLLNSLKNVGNNLKLLLNVQRPHIKTKPPKLHASLAHLEHFKQKLDRPVVKFVHWETIVLITQAFRFHVKLGLIRTAPRLIRNHFA